MASGTPFDRASYISLATYRKDGSIVPTPVWVAPLDGKLVVFTLRETFKVKRVEKNPAVRVAECDVRGNVKGEWRDGTCRIVTDVDFEKRAYAALRKKYGLMMRLGDVMSTLTGRMKRRVVLEITVS
ncbi:MAG TPA: PPOX class F420-dependent oxidoreductase [Polyangiaceae bacterium]